MHRIAAKLATPCLFALILLSRGETTLGFDPRGEQLYLKHCASCHGKAGEGVQGEYEKPLYGDLPVEKLTAVIAKTMPEGEPDECVGEEALTVARYMEQAFYTAEARERNRPPQISVSRLTVQQFDQAVTDLVSKIDRLQIPGGDLGLKGQYYRARNYQRNKRAFERIDSQIDFDFGESTPGENFDPKEFSMVWNGSVVAEETGTYDFVIQTENGVRLWVNDRENKLIDGWVRSGDAQRELKGSLRLLAGRAYPVKLEFLKYHDKTASVRLLWKPPHRPLEVIPSRNLRSNMAQRSFVARNPLPPDDASFGYPRGIAVSKQWDEMTTRVALEAAQYVAQHIDRLAGTRSDAKDRADKIRGYCADLVTRAFGHPLSSSQRDRFVSQHFRNSDSLDEAVRRCVVLTIKSPRFLYPLLPQPEVPAGFAVARQIALALWDSVPDRRLTAAATNGRLLKEQHRRVEITTALNDPRTRIKIQEFFTRWLMLDRVRNMGKDPERFPGFSPELVADLRVSLDMFLDDVFWGQSPDYRRLLLSDKLFVNPRIAAFYGVELSESRQQASEFQLVSMKQQPRTGVVTHPLVLASLAYSRETSPIHRGVFVTRNLLGRRLNPPPEATEFDEAAFDPKLSMRQKVAQLTGSQQCQSCHQVINPLGFSLEHFDAVGRFRTEHDQGKVNAVSDYPSITGKTIRLEGARDLALHAAESKAAQRGFIRQLFEHMVKQPPAAYGPDTLDVLHQRFTDNDYHVRKLLIDVVAVASQQPNKPSEN